jgi:hypothetical protein
VPTVLRVRAYVVKRFVLPNFPWRRDFQKLLTAVTDEQKKDKAYIKRFLKSPSIQDHIVGFKQKLEDARSNLTVRMPLSILLSSCSLLA